MSARRKSREAGPAPETRSPAQLNTFLPDAPPGAMPLDRRTTTVFLVSIVLIVVFQYFGRPDSYRASSLAVRLQPLAESWLGANADLAPYVHWGLSSIVLRVLAPMAVIVFVLREPVADYGWRWRGTGKHLPMYAALYALMIPLIIWASTQASFQQKYPFYKGAAEGGSAFWGYELAYGAQFAGVEFFFRGFLMFALFRKFGYNALLIMAIPYVMIHFNKPLPETFGALGAAFILGTLALRARSCIPGIFIHWAVGMTMDFLAIAKTVGGVGKAISVIFG